MFAAWAGRARNASWLLMNANPTIVLDMVIAWTEAADAILATRDPIATRSIVLTLSALGMAFVSMDNACAAGAGRVATVMKKTAKR